MNEDVNGNRKLFCKASVANVKSDQGDLLMTVPVAGRLSRTNVRSQLTQFIAVRNTLTPTRLSSSVD